MTAANSWFIGQEVQVAPRMWPGINRPGGHGKITKLHFTVGGVVDSIDVKYTLGTGGDNYLDPHLVQPHVELQRGRRSRHQRDLYGFDDKKRGTSKSESGTLHGKENEGNAVDELNQPREHEKKEKQSAPKPTKKHDREGDEKIENPHKKKVKPLQTVSRKKDQTERAPKKKKSESRRNTKSIKVIPDKKSDPKKTSRKDSDNREAKTSKRTSAKADKQKAHQSGSKKGKEMKEDKIAVPKLILASISSTESVSPLQDSQDICFRLTQLSAKDPDFTDGTGRPMHMSNPKTLKDVYDDQVRDASNFVSGLLGNMDVCSEGGAKKSKDLQEAKEDDGKHKLSTERRCLLVKLFSDVLRDCDMAIEEERVLEELNKLLVRQNGEKIPLFTEEEVRFGVHILSEQNKVMKSEGYLYGI